MFHDFKTFASADFARMVFQRGKPNEIPYFHGSEYKHYCIPGCTVVQSGACFVVTCCLQFHCNKDIELLHRVGYEEYNSGVI
jgi:hypothetical protein